MWPVRDVEAPPGSGDCEARLDTWGQPVLLTSSVAYLVAALVVLWWARRHDSRTTPVPPVQIWLYAAGLVAAGLGSMDYHGPALGRQPLLHDGGLALALVAALSIDLTALRLWRPARSWGLLGLTVAAFVVIALVPPVSPALAGVAALGLIAAELAVYRRGLRRTGPALFAGLACLAVGGLIFSLSRTGGPWCDPTSPLQGHAVWHVLTAAALALWAVSALPDRKDLA